MFIQLDHDSIEQCRDETHAVLPESNVHMAIATKGIHAISLFPTYAYSQPVWLNLAMDAPSDPKATARSIQASILAGAGCRTLLKMYSVLQFCVCTIAQSTA